MPSNVIAAAPVDVFPAILATAFSEEVRVEALVNNYPDGSSDRAPLVTHPRKFFKQTTALTLAQWDALRTFYFGHIAQPFYFYYGRETVPPYTSDPTGADTVGRYTVVFDGGYSDAIGQGRSTVSSGLREVE
jgi:hypothetical protein